MSKKLAKAKQQELDQLKDLKLHVTDSSKTSLVIYGGESNITLHLKNGATQNEGLFQAMMKALKEKLNEKIVKLEE